MKKQTKKHDPSYGTKTEWINEANAEIENLQDDISTLDIPQKTKDIIEREIVKFRERMRGVIQDFSIDSKMVFAQKDLFEYCLDDIYYERALAGEYEIERMVEIVEQERKGTFVKAESLAEQMKLEAFMDEMRENPYQLKLIA